VRSETLQLSLRDSRRKREEESVQFMGEMKAAQENNLAKERLVWSRYG
jgi:hypothetical protein